MNKTYLPCRQQIFKHSGGSSVSPGTSSGKHIKFSTGKVGNAYIISCIYLSVFFRQGNAAEPVGRPEITRDILISLETR